MKYQPYQTSLPFVEKSPGLSLNRERFIHYLTKSIEIDLEEAQRLYEQIEGELEHFKGENKIEFLERILSSKIEHYPIKKPPAPFTTSVGPKVQVTPNARIVLEKRYLRKNDKGKILETPEQLFERVAKAIAAPDKSYGHEKDLRETQETTEKIFFDMLSNLEFLPNSPTLMNAGTELGQLSACFVLPIEDSIDSIFETLKHTAIIQKSGGGTGFNFSKLRSKNSPIKTTQGTSSGPLSFISIFNSVTDTIKQGGTRRGANMAILNIDHPDILDFIHSKEAAKEAAKEADRPLTNFNISVAITEKFMEQVKKNETYSLIDPTTGKVTGTLNAKEVFDQIIKAAWKTGDPGIVFLDRMNKGQPTPHIGHIESTNPCGEQYLLPYESCNLGSINLNTVMKGTEIDWKKLESITKTAVHFLDNVIDANAYPLAQIEKITKSNRKIGLGVMGLADVLIQKNISYSSEEALKFAEDIISFIRTHAHEASQELAKERGAFPNFKGSIYDKAGQKPLRNATVITIAPTGTLSIIAGCSSGIEPLFSKSYERHVLEGEVLPEKHEGNVITAHEISPEWHVRMQAVFQKYSDNAVSKTVNLPQSATVEDVRKVYWLAYDLGCKGVTIYRDRSKDSQVLNLTPKTPLPQTFDIAPQASGTIHITLNLNQPLQEKTIPNSELSCPECHELFEHEEGCTFCGKCGYMKCS